jgi:hypothetical protein
MISLILAILYSELLQKHFLRGILVSSSCGSDKTFAGPLTSYWRIINCCRRYLDDFLLMVCAPARWCRDGLSRDCVGNHSGCYLLALGVISYLTFAWRDTQNVKAYGVTENEIKTYVFFLK